MRACSVYNGLILCRRHCFTIVAHNWKFWQMYFAWNIVLKFYMCICIVLWMYFLILTPELSVIFLSSCLLYPSLWRLFRGRRLRWLGPPLLLLYCILYVLFFVCSFKRTALWLKQAWTLSGEMHFYLFKSPWWVSNRKDCYILYLPPPVPVPLAPISLSIYQADGNVMIFVLWTRKCLQHGYSDDFLVFNLYDGVMMIINDKRWGRQLDPVQYQRE